MNRKIKRRKFLKRVSQAASFFGAGGTMQFVLAACAGNISTPASTTSSAAKVKSEGLKTSGLLQWGSEYTSGAPYVFKDPRDPSKIIGFEVEIADAIAKLMGISQTQVQTAYAQLSASLLSNKFDIVMNGWEITEDRQQTQLFSQPYYRYGQQIVVRANDPRFSSVTTTSDFTLTNLKGLTVGTGLGYKAEEILKSDSKIKTKAYDGNLPFDDVKQKKLDAMMVDLPIVAYYVLGSGPGGTSDPTLKLAGKPILSSDYVVGFNKSNPQATTLLSEINQAFDILKKDGTLKGIYQRWQMWNDQQAGIGIS